MADRRESNLPPYGNETILLLFFIFKEAPMNTVRQTVFTVLCGLAVVTGTASAQSSGQSSVQSSAANPATPPTVAEAPVGPGPSMENASVGNIAGLMYYCHAHDIVDDTTVRSLGRSLAGRADVKNDPTYPEGGVGRLTVGAGRTVDLTTAAGDVRTATCAHAAQRGIELDDGTFLLPFQE